MVSGCFLPSGFFWPGRVTSSVSPGKADIQRLGLQVGLGLLQHLLNVGADLVCQLADDRPILGG